MNDPSLPRSSGGSLRVSLSGGPRIFFWGGATVLALLLVWLSMSLQLLVRAESDIPRTLHVAVGSGKRPSQASALKLNKTSSAVPQTISLGRECPTWISLTFAGKDAPVVVRELRVTNGLGVSLGEIAVVGSPVEVSARNQSWKVPFPKAELFSRQIFTAIATVVLALLLWTCANGFGIWAWRHLERRCAVSDGVPGTGAGGHHSERETNAASQQRDNGSRIAQLDGIRGIAVIMVLLWHYVGCQAGASLERVPGLMSVLSFGGSGVDLFFVLSGFLICGILLDQKGTPNYFPTFYVRRTCRIFPLYFLLLVTFGGAYAVQRLDAAAFSPFSWLFQDPLPLWSYATFTQNIQMALQGTFGPNWLGITWSLAVEEQFYLLMPLLVHACSRRTLTVILVSALISAPLLTWLWPGFHSYVCLPWRCESIVAGSLLALGYRNDAAMRVMQRKGLLPGLFVFFLAGVGVMIVDPNVFGVFAHVWWAGLYSSFVMLTLAREQGFLARMVRRPTLFWFGLLSYGIYMLHQLVSGLIHGLIRGAAPGMITPADMGVTLAAFVATLAIASLSHRYLELPILRKGKRFNYVPDARVPS